MDTSISLYIELEFEISICVREDKIHSIIRDFHEEPYGGDFVNKRTRHKVLTMGYFWPNLFQDEKKYVQVYSRCQRMGHLNRLDEIPLQPQLVVEPFDRWALNFVGLINHPSKKKFIFWFVQSI